jgi:hypothetical protein
MPITVSFSGAERKIGWKLEPEHIDYHLYLPIFFEGLRETEEPYKFLADRVQIFNLYKFIGMHITNRTRRLKVSSSPSLVDYPY